MIDRRVVMNIIRDTAPVIVPCNMTLTETAGMLDDFRIKHMLDKKKMIGEIISHTNRYKDPADIVTLHLNVPHFHIERLLLDIGTGSIEIAYALHSDVWSEYCRCKKHHFEARMLASNGISRDFKFITVDCIID